MDIWQNTDLTSFSFSEMCQNSRLQQVHVEENHLLVRKLSIEKFDEMNLT